MYKIFTFVSWLLVLAIYVVSTAEAHKHRSSGERQHKTLQPRQTIARITDDITIALGVGFGNMILIEGDDGLIVVDTLKNRFEARVAYRLLTRNTNKTLKAIILTHFHLDHIGGADGLKEEFGDSATRIFAHHSMEFERSRYARVSSFYTSRIAYQFGKDPFKYCADDLRPCLDTATVTDSVSDNDTVNIAGLKVQFIHMIGETNDHLSIWIPSKKALLVGDNVYNSFPNICTLRGAPTRDANAWYHSLSRMRKFRPTYLIFSHGVPLQGVEKVDAALVIYRDGIQYVHDQTVRLMNHGLPLSQIVEKVKLPTHLKTSKMLLEKYGAVEWSVRGVYDHYNGWFEGEVEQMYPLSKPKLAEFIQELIAADYNGSVYDKMLDHADSAWSKSHRHFQTTSTLLADQLKWGIYLCSIASELGESQEPSKRKKLDDIEIKLIESMVQLNRGNMIAYNFYSTHMHFKGVGAVATILNPVQHFPLNQAFEVLPYRFKAEICEPYLIMKLLLWDQFSPGQRNGYILRNCVIEHVTDPDEDHFDHVINLSSSEFRQIFSKNANPNMLSISDENLAALTRFLSFID